MRDLYSKICLTVIALALVAHVFIQLRWVNAWTGWPFGPTWEQVAEEWERELKKKPVSPQGKIAPPLEKSRPRGL